MNAQIQMYTNRFKIIFSFYFFPNTFILLAKYNAFNIFFSVMLVTFALA